MTIHLTDVSLRYDGKHILQDITWDVQPGEHWAIIGLNGSGKTTLLNIINGYIWPTTGEVTVLGKHFGRCDVRKLRRKIGWVSSSLQERLYGGETSLDIVLSGKFATIGLYDRPARADVEHGMDLLSQLQCDPIAHRPYGSLSQGEKQKVLIARALAASPQLLILDEPCAGLDLFARENLLSSLEVIAERRGLPTILYVSHHIEEISPVFAHSLLLRRGRIHSAGGTREVLTQSNLSDFFETPLTIHWKNGRAWVRI